MPQFEYKKYDQSPYVGHISDLLRAPAEAQAQAAMAIGNARAQGALAQGQASSNLAQQIGGAAGMVAGIPAEMQKAKAFELAQQRAATEAALAGTQLEEARQKRADVAALDAFYKLKDPESQILSNQNLPGNLKPIVTKQFADANKARAQFQKTSAELEQIQNEYLAGLASSVKEHGYD